MKSPARALGLPSSLCLVPHKKQQFTQGGGGVGGVGVGGGWVGVGRLDSTLLSGRWWAILLSLLLLLS